MLVSTLSELYQSAFQGFENDAISNTRLSILVQPSDLEKLTERIILCHFSFLFTPTKQASSLLLLGHFMFVAGHFVIVNKNKLCPNKEMK